MESDKVRWRLAARVGAARSRLASARLAENVF
jgi:hypothetical protein